MKFAVKYLLSRYKRELKDTILTVINFILAALLIAFWSFYIFSANGIRRGYQYYENAVFRCSGNDYPLLYKELKNNRYSSPVSEIAEFDVSFMLEDEFSRRGYIFPTPYAYLTYIPSDSSLSDFYRGLGCDLSSLGKGEVYISNYLYAGESLFIDKDTIYIPAGKSAEILTVKDTFFSAEFGIYIITSDKSVVERLSEYYNYQDRSITANINNSEKFKQFFNDNDFPSVRYFYDSTGEEKYEIPPVLLTLILSGSIFSALLEYVCISRKHKKEEQYFLWMKEAGADRQTLFLIKAIDYSVIYILSTVASLVIVRIIYPVVMRPIDLLSEYVSLNSIGYSESFQLYLFSVGIITAFNTAVIIVFILAAVFRNRISGEERTVRSSRMYLKSSDITFSLACIGLRRGIGQFLLLVLIVSYYLTAICRYSFSPVDSGLVYNGLIFGDSDVSLKYRGDDYYTDNMSELLKYYEKDTECEAFAVEEIDHCEINGSEHCTVTNMNDFVFQKLYPYVAEGDLAAIDNSSEYAAISSDLADFLGQSADIGETISVNINGAIRELKVGAIIFSAANETANHIYVVNSEDIDFVAPRYIYFYVKTSSTDDTVSRIISDLEKRIYDWHIMIRNNHATTLIENNNTNNTSRLLNIISVLTSVITALYLYLFAYMYLSDRSQSITELEYLGFGKSKILLSFITASAFVFITSAAIVLMYLAFGLFPSVKQSVYSYNINVINIMTALPLCVLSMITGALAALAVNDKKGELRSWI